jgi:hypothetical protein
MLIMNFAILKQYTAKNTRLAVLRVQSNTFSLTYANILWKN